MANTHHEVDVAIIGGGPAGLCAGIWLGRFLHDVAVIDSGDPRNWKAQEIHGYLGASKVRPADMRHRGRQACRSYNIELLDDRVEQATHHGREHFELTTTGGRNVEARRVLICTGIRDRWPDIPGLERCYGTSIHTCPNCDGFESRDQRCAVIGSTAKAADVALAMLTWTDQVFICTHGASPDFQGAQPTLDEAGVEVLTEPVESLDERDGQLKAIQFSRGHSERCGHIFLAMGQHARDDVGAHLGCRRDERGFIIIDDHHHTSVYNVFAAGDVTPGAQMAVRAAAGGAEAALSVHHSLIPEHRRVHRRC